MKDRIKMVRQNAGLNQEDFAKLLGIAQGYVSQLETGKEKPSELLINAICSKFGIEREWLVSGTGDMNESLKSRIMWGIKLYGFKEVEKIFNAISKDYIKTYRQPIIDAEFNNIMDWLLNFWTHSNHDMQAWIKIQLKRAFPEYNEQGRAEPDNFEDITNPK